MKYALSLAIIVAFSLTACNTLSGRRELWSPTKAHGPWNQRLDELTPQYHSYSGGPATPPTMQPLHSVPVPHPTPVLKPLHR